MILSIDSPGREDFSVCWVLVESSPEIHPGNCTPRRGQATFRPIQYNHLIAAELCPLIWTSRHVVYPGGLRAIVIFQYGKRFPGYSLTFIMNLSCYVSCLIIKAIL